MYFPRLRAKQFDVLAVSNAVDSGLRPGLLTPVVEPVVELNPAALKRLERWAELGIRCDLVLNPGVGLYAGNWRALAAIYEASGLLEAHDVAILVDARADHAGMATWVNGASDNAQVSNLDLVFEPGGSTTLTGTTYRGVRNILAEDRTAALPYGLPLSSRPYVWSGDPFPEEARNADYLGRPPSIFSARPWSFQSAGYLGVSDFLINGRRYNPGGGRAWAVVIHLTYIAGDSIHIAHFVSDSNEDSEDPAGKFKEAINKLMTFLDDNSIADNPAIEEYRDLYESDHFPNLGKSKEIQMKNHLFVMERALQMQA